MKNHSLTFGGAFEKFHSDNSFYFGIQSAYSYASLADFYADANGYLANPNRTVSPVTLLNFQVKYLLQPGQTIPPLQPLDVRYTSGYGQDEWRTAAELHVDGRPARRRAEVRRYGVRQPGRRRADVPRSGWFSRQVLRPAASRIRRRTGRPAWASTGMSCRMAPRRCAAEPASSPASRRSSGSRTRSATPACCTDSSRAEPPPRFRSTRIRTDTSQRRPAASASSYELDVTDASFRFPQTWRTNIGADRKLPWGLVGTVDFIYNRDVNAPVYINANLPPAESAYTGVDNRPRWVATTAFPACITSGGPFGTGGQAGPCVTRLNNAVGNSVTAAYVIKNQNQNRSWDIAGSVAKTLTHGFARSGAATATACRRASSSHRPRQAVRGGRRIRSRSTRTTRRWRTRRTRLASACSSRPLIPTSTFRFGSTTVSAFYEAHPTYCPSPGLRPGRRARTRATSSRATRTETL